MPVELPFMTLDVFATERYKGNQLAVVTVPKGTSPKLSQAQKQAIAQEFNLSETVIVHEEHEDSSGAPNSRHIDIFLVDAEVPFAGHPTIGTAVSLISQGVTELVTKAGPIALTQTQPGVIQAEIPHSTHLHVRTFADLPHDATPSGTFSSDDTIRSAELAAPLFSIVKGMTFALIKLPSLDHLRRVGFTPTNFSPDILDDGWKQGIVGRYYYVHTGSGGNGNEKRSEIRTRMILQSIEDAATGSAACALSSYLTVTADSKDDRTAHYGITQGVEMGRESNMFIEISTKGGQVDRVGLAGAAVEVMRGSITV